LTRTGHIIAQASQAANGRDVCAVSREIRVPLALGRWCGRAHGPLVPWFLINTMKAMPMSLTTWNTTLTAKIDDDAVQAMRNFLRQNLASVPFRRGDVITKYLRHVIESNNEWDGIDAPVAFTRPLLTSRPWQSGFEREWHLLLAEPSPKLLLCLERLAIGSFGLLSMLACYVAFAG
jgi:hypothetical protein